MAQYNVVYLGGAMPQVMQGYGVFDAPMSVTVLGLDPKLYAIRPVEDPNWRERERKRFEDGTYKRPPWPDHFLKEITERYPDHFLHMSTKKEKHLSYTEDETKGAIDRQSAPITPGRYLTKFFSDWYSAETIRNLAMMVVGDDHELRITQDADEIEDIYVRTRWTHSCMSYSADHFEGDEHPARVYAGPDLALAYVLNPDDEDENTNVRARCLVWPEKKVYGRIYGDADVIMHLLKQRGYTRGSLEGARIRRIRHGGICFVLPYIDYYYKVRDERDYFVIDSGGDVIANDTNGLGFKGFWCESCEEPTSEDDYGGEHYGSRYCERCCHDLFVECEETGQMIYKSASVTLYDGSIVSESWFEEHGVICDRTGRRIRPSEAVTLVDTDETVHLVWAEDHAFQDDCGVWYAAAPEPEVEVELEEAA